MLRLSSGDSSFYEDMIQEEGHAGRRIGATSSSNSYTICVSLESLFILWNRIY